MEKFVSRYSSLGDRMRLGMAVYGKLLPETSKVVSPETVALIVGSILEQGYTIFKTVSDAERNVRTMTADELRQELRGLEERDPINMTSWAEIRFEKIADELSRREEPSQIVVVDRGQHS